MSMQVYVKNTLSDHPNHIIFNDNIFNSSSIYYEDSHILLILFVLNIHNQIHNKK